MAFINNIINSVWINNSKAISNLNHKVGLDTFYPDIKYVFVGTKTQIKHLSDGFYYTAHHNPLFCILDTILESDLAANRKNTQ